MAKKGGVSLPVPVLLLLLLTLLKLLRIRLRQHGTGSCHWGSRTRCSRSLGRKLGRRGRNLNLRRWHLAMESKRRRHCAVDTKKFRVHKGHGRMRWAERPNDLISARSRVRRDQDPLRGLRARAIKREALTEKDGVLIVRLRKKNTDTVTSHRMLLQDRLLEVHSRQLLWRHNLRVVRLARVVGDQGLDIALQKCLSRQSNNICQRWRGAVRQSRRWSESAAEDYERKPVRIAGVPADDSADGLVTLSRNTNVSSVCLPADTPALRMPVTQHREKK